MSDDHAIPAWVSAGILVLLIALSARACTARHPDPDPTTDAAGPCWPAEGACHA